MGRGHCIFANQKTGIRRTSIGYMKGILFLSLAVGLLIIGIHQAMVYGITESYWVFMFAVCFLLLYRYFKKPEEKIEGKDSSTVEKNTRNEGIEGEGKVARKMRRKKKVKKL